LSRLNRLLFGKRSKKSSSVSVYDSIDKQRLPVHVAVIMDGNGRWAKSKGLPRSAGHRAGVERVRTIIRMSSDIGIKHLSLYAFSTENWKRPKAEVSTLMRLLLEYLRDELNELNEKNVRIKTLGDLSGLPKEVAAEVERATFTTRNNTGLTVNMAINYGARQEIVRAMKKAIDEAQNTDEIDEAYISKLLYTANQPDPDLMIRTSGEKRISNYLLYQLAYAELYFTDTRWPDFDEKQYAKALNDFASRDRRFGGV
jgi:undecaprenyl diphosphate synthase